MDPIEASTTVYNRILKFEPPDVTKQIFGHLLIHLCKQEFIRLSFCPENLILNLIQSVKMELGLVPYQQVISPPISPSMNPNPISVPSPFWIPQIIPNNRRLLVDTKLNGEDFGIREHTNSAVPPFPCGYYHAETLFPRGPRSPSEFPIKTCHYFKKGFCKHGTKCRFFHEKPLYFSNGFSRMDESGFEEQSLSPGSLEKLEFEITELLKTKRGTPVSIASLPSLYLDKYGHNLQADGYLTESQRHGKVGYSLTKLLARLRNSILLIDRPHGQHDVVLAEDAHHFFESHSDRHDPVPILLGSRQIYLTFPAESTFSEEDVADYFSTYGVVQDVRIPCQNKRMFGFVTFASADTVKIILSKGNPHYVCGARVLVKPYKEKSKLIDRKYPDKHDHSMLYGSHYAELSELQSRWESRFMREPYMAEQEENVEAQIRQLSKMQLASSQSLANNSCLGYTLNQLGVQEDNSDFPSAERYKYLLDVLDTDESEGDNLGKQTEANNNADPKSYEVNLPE